jgi:hypothetical protein
MRKPGEVVYTSQSRFNFDIDNLVSMGIKRAYVTPFAHNNQCLCEPDVIIRNLEKLAEMAKAAKAKGLDVYPFFVTINHPEGNYQIPKRYRMQQNLDGSFRTAFICFQDKVRQEEMIRYACKAAELGFERMSFDDDLRDAFCYCDEHLKNYEPFKNKSREQIAQILNDVFLHPEYEQIRLGWYEYKFDKMKEYAVRIEGEVHKINPSCRIGICNSAKRCHDFSGRDMAEWAELFSTEKSPTFIRLTGECYDDNIFHLAQATGWHIYTNQVFSEKIEKSLEVTCALSIDYRSPQTVIFESSILPACTKVNQVHWAWTEEYGHSRLNEFVGPAKKKINDILNETPSLPTSPLSLYVGQNLGAYTPTDISVNYGASHDPIIAYNTIALCGLPIVTAAEIKDKNDTVICSAYISRNMIEQIDKHLEQGGNAILDAVAARCYRTYGGQTKFEIEEPKNLHLYEQLNDGQKDETIADCPPATIYTIKCSQDQIMWQSFDISENLIGTTAAMIKQGKGKLFILGYDISQIGVRLVRPAWQKRILNILSLLDANVPVYWDGPVAVQLFYYGKKVAVANYNHNKVNGSLVVSGAKSSPVDLEPRQIRFVDI